VTENAEGRDDDDAMTGYLSNEFNFQWKKRNGRRNTTGITACGPVTLPSTQVTMTVITYVDTDNCSVE